eukprot:m.247998 g.247998  ORF g.247998 m.247998 type:complete len:767 (+) comp10969_c2_seq3:461-2761(+)
MPPCAICKRTISSNSREAPPPDRSWLRDAIEHAGLPFPANQGDTRELFRHVCAARDTPALASLIASMGISDFRAAGINRFAWLEHIAPDLEDLREVWLKPSIRVCSVHFPPKAKKQRARDVHPSLFTATDGGASSSEHAAAAAHRLLLQGKLVAFKETLTKAQQAANTLSSLLDELLVLEADVPLSKCRKQHQDFQGTMSRVVARGLRFFKHENVARASTFASATFTSLLDSLPTSAFHQDERISMQAERLALASGNLRTLRSSRLASSNIPVDDFRSLFGFPALQVVEAYLDLLNMHAAWTRVPLFRSRKQFCDLLDAGSYDDARMSSRALSQLDSFLLTLYLLRTGVPFRNAAFFFNISRSTAQRVFSTTVIFLYIAMQERQLFLDSNPTPPQFVTHVFNRPAAFEDLPEVFMILDATEFGVQAFSDLKVRRTSYSQYKSKLTIKVLVCVSEYGHISFVSRGYLGTISDNFITDVTNVLLRVPEETAIMADKGFTIAYQAAEHKLFLYTPPRVKNHRATDLATNLCRLVARRRVHVEIAIGQMRTWRYLSKPVKVTQIDLFSALIRIIGHLTNATCKSFAPRGSFSPAPRTPSSDMDVEDDAYHDFADDAHLDTFSGADAPPDDLAAHDFPNDGEDDVSNDGVHSQATHAVVADAESGSEPQNDDDEINDIHSLDELAAFFSERLSIGPDTIAQGSPEQPCQSPTQSHVSAVQPSQPNLPDDPAGPFSQEAIETMCSAIAANLRSLQHTVKEMQIFDSSSDDEQ